MNVHNYLPKTIFSFLLLICFALNSHGQTKELGIRMTGLQNFDFIYKKEKAPNKFSRIRLGLANISFANINDENVANLALGIAMGSERRKAINEKLNFYQGPEPFANLALNVVADNTLFTVQGGLGYVLGFQYNFSEVFYVSAETIPSVGVTFSSGENLDPSLGISAGFNSNAVALTLAYRILGNSK
ncbi:MAG: hypothetical protein AAFR87_17725 [Bacteroidota bacterium]